MHINCKCNNTVFNESMQDMDLIEILWKQDIDLGVTRDAYDSRQCLEAEKLKELEFSKEKVKDCFNHKDIKVEEDLSVSDELSGFNYTIDSETGEYIIEGLADFNGGENFVEDSSQSKPIDAIRQDSYLPFDENAQMLNLTEVFSPSTIDQLLPENFSTDSDFFLSQIEDLEKELAQFEPLNVTSGENYAIPGDMFPNLDDCLLDANNVLPILALNGAYQESFTSLSQRTGQDFNVINDTVPIPSLQLNRSPESFTNLLQNTSLEMVNAEEVFSAMPSVVGASSVGCAVAESMATLTNDTDPVPSGSIATAAYNSEFPEILYTNQTGNLQNELQFSDLLLDDYMLTGLPSNVQRITSEDNMESSCDSTSLTSRQNRCVSDCTDVIDSSSDSSYFDEREFTHTNIRSSCSTVFNEPQTFELFHSAMPPKKLKPIQNRSERVNRKMSESKLDHNQHYFTYKSSFSDLSENSTGMTASPNGACKKFDVDAAYPNPSETGATDILLHNHSYHLPFVHEQSRYKPFMRDKSKSSSDEDYCQKDERRAKELKLPISIDDIINLSIDEYNERLSKYELTEAQLTLIRDIRRRGKNKVAAQNCRKRKMDQISSLQQDLNVLHRERSQLKSRQNHLLQQKHHIEDKYSQLYQLVLQSSTIKPPGPPNNHPGHDINGVTFSMTSDIFMSDDDTDLSRGARTKRKMKK